MNTGRTARPMVRAARRLDTRISRLLALLAALSLLLLAAGPVFAHADLVSSDPPDGAALDTPPTAVTLTFSEGLDAAKSRFQLLAADGSLVGTGLAAADGDETMTLADLDLAPGDYLVKWTSVSVDTDIERGELRFTVTAASPTPATPAPTAPATAAPSPSAGTPAASAGPSLAAGTDDQQAATSSALGEILLPIVAALVVVAVVGAYLLRRSRSA